MSQTNQANPWLSMWTQPRETIRWIVQTNPRYGVFWLAIIYVLQGFFFFMNFWSFGLSSSWYSLLIHIVILTPLFAFVWIFFYGWILRCTGRWLGGPAPGSHLRAALAWSRIPMTISLAMWFFLLITNPDYVFIQYVGGTSAIFVLFINGILEIWSFVLFIQSIREVQHFTIIRSLCNIFLASAIYSTLIFSLMLLARYVYLM